MGDKKWGLLLFCGGLLLFALVLIWLEGHVENIWMTEQWLPGQPILPWP